MKGRTHPAQDTPLSQGHSHPHSLRLGFVRHADSPHVNTFGLWEETRVPGEKHTNMGEHGRNAGSTHTVEPMTSYQGCNDMTSDTLLENLLHARFLAESQCLSAARWMRGEKSYPNSAAIGVTMVNATGHQRPGWDRSQTWPILPLTH